jgi:hypothetical protein
VEVADVRSGIWEGEVGAAVKNVSFVGYAVSVAVDMKFWRNQTVDSAGGRVSETRSVSLEMGFLYGGNVLTMFGGEDGGIVWLKNLTVA